MSETLQPPIWVDNVKLLAQLIADVESQTRVAVDTESNSLHAFREQVCLIQFSTINEDYLLDPLMFDDLSGLAPFFANPKIEKIFHAAEYDLICLNRDFSFNVSNLFDTMHAARVLGYKAVGLDRLLGEKFGVEMDKRHQKANWAVRPLKEDQIHYARLDTHYLFNLRDALENELREKERLSFALEDFTSACNVEKPKPARANGSWRRISARKDVSLRDLTILFELMQVRDTVAEKLNRPAFKVVADDTLLVIARNQASKKVDLSGVGLSEKQIRLWGDSFLEAVTRGLEAPLVKREQPKMPSDATLRRLEKLKAWRKKVAEKMEVESDVVLPKRYLGALSENPPTDIDDLKIIMKDSPSRVEKYGSQLVRLAGV